MENLKSKVVIITGASSGIGEATAKLLAQRGAKVVLAARREDRLQTLVKDIEAEGGKAVYIRTNVASFADMQKLVQFALEQYGRIDVLVNNAGVMPLSQLNELKVQEWDQMIDINIKGVLYGIAAVLPTMREQQAGHIINLSSMAGYSVSPTSSVYSATKFAVRAISEGLRQEESPASHIRSTIISPGLTESELTNGISNPEIKAWVGQANQLAISPYSIARAIAYAINEPDDTGINEIIIRPTLQPS
ncbi:SDR family oxidoreductase [Paenibacillus monticola]|uniref:SDR family NAD(P)-dependent oxidoreductase n=1 Tax=Paenibacillus monticola TaxID=2666075 RepID=A0A7X2H409_9BACL|nr:SDR family oxidoreductase [Paenibacillus monticola]MRN53161.1 SDR family NAD(P)-dependent oxidoreductase [Paenibacillus monticola]